MYSVALSQRVIVVSATRRANTPIDPQKLSIIGKNCGHCQDGNCDNMTDDEDEDEE